MFFQSFYLVVLKQQSKINAVFRVVVQQFYNLEKQADYFKARIR